MTKITSVGHSVEKWDPLHTVVGMYNSRASGENQIFHGFGQICNDLYYYSIYHIEEFHCPKILCAPPIHPSLLLSLWIFWLSPSFFIFQKGHVDGISQYTAAFSDWLLILNVIHIFAWCSFSSFHQQWAQSLTENRYSNGICWVNELIKEQMNECSSCSLFDDCG